MPRPLPLVPPGYCEWVDCHQRTFGVVKYRNGLTIWLCHDDFYYVRHQHNRRIAQASTLADIAEAFEPVKRVDWNDLLARHKARAK